MAPAIYVPWGESEELFPLYKAQQMHFVFTGEDLQFWQMEICGDKVLYCITSLTRSEKFGSVPIVSYDISWVLNPEVFGWKYITHNNTM